MKKNLPIYLISLEQDSKRREQLKQRFPKTYDSFQIIPAIYGNQLNVKEYFNQTVHFVKYSNRMMSPAELGCSYSHINVLKNFLSTNEQICLILEDDIIGSDEDIEKISKLAEKINEDSVLICGCQDGLVSVKYLYGKKILKEQIWELSKFSYDYITRAAAYVVTRNSAKAILDYQKKGIMLADNWDVLLTNTSIKIYFVDIISHPIELENSYLETDRAIFRDKPKSILQKLLSKDVFMKIFRKFKIIISIQFLKVTGNKKIISEGK